MSRNGLQHTVSQSYTSFLSKSFNDSPGISESQLLNFEKVLCQSFSLLVDNSILTIIALDKLQEDLKEVAEYKRSIDQV